MYICTTELLCYITKIYIVNELHINKEKNFFPIKKKCLQGFPW